MGRFCVSRILEALQLSKVTAGSQRNLDKSRLCQKVRDVPPKMLGKSVREEIPVGKKCPLKTVVLTVDEKRQSKVAG